MDGWRTGCFKRKKVYPTLHKLAATTTTTTTRTNDKKGSGDSVRCCWMLDDEATIIMGIHHEPREVPCKVPKQAEMGDKV